MHYRRPGRVRQSRAQKPHPLGLAALQHRHRLQASREDRWAGCGNGRERSPLRSRADARFRRRAPFQEHHGVDDGRSRIPTPPSQASAGREPRLVWSQSERLHRSRADHRADEQSQCRRSADRSHRNPLRCGDLTRRAPGSTHNMGTENRLSVTLTSRPGSGHCGCASARQRDPHRCRRHRLRIRECVLPSTAADRDDPLRATHGAISKPTRKPRGARPDRVSLEPAVSPLGACHAGVRIHR